MDERGFLSSENEELTLINFRISLLCRNSGARHGFFDLWMLESTRLQQGISVRRNLIRFRRCRSRHDELIECKAEMPLVPVRDVGDVCSFNVKFNVCSSSSIATEQRHDRISLAEFGSRRAEATGFYLQQVQDSLPARLPDVVEQPLESRPLPSSRPNALKRCLAASSRILDRYLQWWHHPFPRRSVTRCPRRKQWPYSAAMPRRRMVA